MRRNTLVTGVVAIVVVWILVVTVLISREPETGAASPAELRDRLERALTERDADEFGLLLGEPGEQAADFAQTYVDELRGTTGLSVSLRPDVTAPRVATVSGTRQDGGPFSYDLSVSETGGRWLVDLTPPL
ncbi:hypothetical protein DI005_20290 [Prauserella sp. PE36]|uniref:DUF4878 domain-containing protein n=1 Tax=Prauserella endophytica TaxID=1592324 RepID=A0ABY2S3I4_9PSEU|nr:MULTISPECIES: hypothetical protein [Prauserella]PXY34190.1 hypothetical protein BAY59_01110 [Prauserella coralliicola]RBM17980.1 hypothetical protein DI005_20290 [Prauserella sp. PE36]TKG70104.1 hypothetical protein FCN18_18620 [Prauserella endophytica]